MLERHAASAKSAAARKPRMPPLRLCTDRHSVGQFCCTHRATLDGVVRIAQIDIWVVSVNHEFVEWVICFSPSFCRRSNFERKHAVRDIVAVTHGDKLASIDIHEQRGFILAVQWRSGGDDHPLYIRCQAVKIERLAEYDFDDASGAAVGNSKPGGLGHASVLKPRRKLDRLCDGEIPEAIGLDPHGSQRRSVQSGLRQQNHRALVVVVGFRRTQLCCERRYMACISRLPDGDRFLQCLVAAHDSYAERQTLFRHPRSRQRLLHGTCSEDTVHYYGMLNRFHLQTPPSQKTTRHRLYRLSLIHISEP